MLRMPAFGLSGPYKNYRAFGTHIEGMIGHHYLRGYPEGDPGRGGRRLHRRRGRRHPGRVRGDDGAAPPRSAPARASRSSSRRPRTSCRCSATHPRYTMNGGDPGPQGNRHRSHAPHQAYPWQARRGNSGSPSTSATDEEFAALCSVFGNEALSAGSGRSRPSEARLRHTSSRSTGDRSTHEQLGQVLAVPSAAGRGRHRRPAAHRGRALPLSAAAEPRVLRAPRGTVGWQWYPGLFWHMAARRTGCVALRSCSARTTSTSSSTSSALPTPIGRPHRVRPGRQHLSTLSPRRHPGRVARRTRGRGEQRRSACASRSS